ncbi:unnamed protein product [Brachionus calyciflorus]|uniref:SAM domain-containing protein n=1 Tax=Brachionus calyciflorus TaxID=104777 RepID=A0A813SLT7_9BILA|nr:unnamed protein product [Brachionus calyciflorus]
MTEKDNSKNDPNDTNADETIDDEDDFDWDEYLKKTNSISAPWECFAQNSTPPVNEFKVGQKLETNDPRNTSSICLATIIEIAGLRLRLRLDGTDNRNDFWLMCDSDLIHPFEYSAKHGRKISPPLGYGNDLSKWPKFLEKILNSSQTNNVFAMETSFKQPPLKPLKNEFKLGHKLEAVDPKNPHLICPATIKEINRDKILISFDGWSNSSQFWIPFTSRDLFPCGWCKMTQHVLQHPGDLDEPKVKKNKSLIKPGKIGNKKKDSVNMNESLNESVNNLPGDTITNDLKKDDKLENIEVFDLSLVKSEAIEPSLDNVNIPSVNSKSKGPSLTLYVRPNFNCGKYVNSQKFHKSHTKFGPGQAANIYKSIVQSFIDCAMTRSQVFEMIPEGNGVQFVRFKTSTSNSRKKINFVKNVKEMWAEIKKICELLDIDDGKLFSTKPFTDIEKINSPPKTSPKTPPLDNNKENLASQAKEKNNVVIASSNKEEFPLTPQPSSCSSSTSSSSGSQEPNLLKVSNMRVNNNNTNNNGMQKRRLSASENETVENSTTPKVYKKDTLPINEWTIENVIEYIQGLGDYFTAHVDAFKHHEIDGKALLLLTTDILMKYMGFKLGPALKLNNFLDKLRVNQTIYGINCQNPTQQMKTEKTFNY